MTALVVWGALGGLVGAFGFWLRGAALFRALTGRGATTARVVAWAFPLALVSWLAGAPAAAAVALGAALWLGCLPPWWSSTDLGRQAGTWARDAFWQALRGALWTLPAGVALGAAGLLETDQTPLLAALAVAASGLVALPAYEVGWRLRPPGTPGFGATEVGEALTGATVGGTLAVAVRITFS